MKKKHAFVLGSGIAGLALAEVLSRNGFRITLLETSPDLGGDASRRTQNWLHTGWLYAASPNRAAMLGCNHALRLFEPIYGHLLPPQTLNLRASEESVSYPASSSGWFAAERVHYLYATATAELSFLQRLGWRHHLEAVTFRRLRQLGYDTTPTTALTPGLIRLLNHWEDSPDGYSKYTVVRSTDAQINTRRVLDTLLGLLGRHARVVTQAEYKLVTQAGRTCVELEGELHTPDLVVLATGKGVPEQLLQLGDTRTAARFKSISSPIVVLKRALELPSFIRFTPKLAETINHIKYEVQGNGFCSTVGSYEFYPAGQLPDISPFINRVCRRLEISTGDVASVYYGTKTEFTGSAERRYNHAIGRVNGNTYWAVPGKFSQFPLLVHEFAAKLGLRTDVSAPERGQSSFFAGATLPEQSFGQISGAMRRGSA